MWIKLPKPSLGVGWGRGGRGENGVKASRLNMTSAGWGSELIQAVHCPGIWSPCLTQLTFGARLEDVAGGWRVTLGEQKSAFRPV